MFFVSFVRRERKTQALVHFITLLFPRAKRDTGARSGSTSVVWWKDRRGGNKTETKSEHGVSESYLTHDHSLHTGEVAFLRGYFEVTVDDTK